MKRELFVFLYISGFLFTLGGNGFARERGTSEEVVNELKQEIQELRDQMKVERRAYDQRLQKMQEKIDAVSRQILEKPAADAEEGLESEIAKSQTEIPSSSSEGAWSGIGRSLQSLNPELSVIIDTYYQNSHFSGVSDGKMSDIYENMAGFGHSHGDDHGHEHGGLDEGFNLRHLELYFAGEVDPYFKAYAIAAIS